MKKSADLYMMQNFKKQKIDSGKVDKKKSTAENQVMRKSENAE